MELVVARRPTVKQTTFGRLSINDHFECYTLEDAVREIHGGPVTEWKIPGETAIPRGRYRLALEDSPKFGPDTMTLKDVPGFSYIRIHAGNDDSDTEGCLLVGQRILEQQDDGGNILDSRAALTALKIKVLTAINTWHESVFLTVRGP